MSGPGDPALRSGDGNDNGCECYQRTHWNGMESMECSAVEWNGMESMECSAVEWNGMESCSSFWLIVGHYCAKSGKNKRPSAQPSRLV